jgi:hypothetical protein
MICAFLTGVLLAAGPEVIVAEGERFRPEKDQGWRVAEQDETHASINFGGMFLTHGAALLAPAEVSGSIAVSTIEVKVAGKYRVWSKYQAPPYFNYLHRVEIWQKKKRVFSGEYGRARSPRLFSFGAVSDELWWSWGIDHDAAEAPKEPVDLERGPAEVRLVSERSPEPAGDRVVDFVLLTTELGDTYAGMKPGGTPTPFLKEALDATRLYFRFENEGAGEAKLTLSRGGHLQGGYGTSTMTVSAPARAFSPWTDLGPWLRLVTDEGITLKLGAGQKIRAQIARDASGKDLVGDVTVPEGEAILIPKEITWKRGARVESSRELARRIVEASKSWRTNNGGKKPTQILFFGAFSRSDEKGWLAELKDAIGYNTELPDRFAHAPRDRHFAHAPDAKAVDRLAARLTEKERLLIVSFGDEISLGDLRKTGPAEEADFRRWLEEHHLTRAELGVDPREAKPTKTGDPRLVWYSARWHEESRFTFYRELTGHVRELFGPSVLTGANYSPHGAALYYGSIGQWIDLFRAEAMTMFWTEDYVFAVPEVPQIVSWQLAQVRAAVRAHGQPIHYYAMPHAPGQDPSYLRRNMLLAIGFGAAHVDNFWVAPEESFTENYVAWSYGQHFRAIHEAIFDSAEAEALQNQALPRPAEVALIIGRATELNESRLRLDKKGDRFAAAAQNAPQEIEQTLCRKEQQMLYLALRRAHHAVDLFTEEDVAKGALGKYRTAYFAGEWIDRSALKGIESWVRGGGTFYAAGGLGRFDHLGAPSTALLSLLGIEKEQTEKSAINLRTRLELPLEPPIDTIAFEGAQIPVVALRQRLTPAKGTEVLATWSDGSAAATKRALGKGQLFAVGALPGTSSMRLALPKVPGARGGRRAAFSPERFDPNAEALARLGVDASKVERGAIASDPRVEPIILDGPKGTLLTLVSWANAPLHGIEISIALAQAPKEVRSIAKRKKLPSEWDGKRVRFTVDLEDADFILLPNGK